MAVCARVRGYSCVCVACAHTWHVHTTVSVSLKRLVNSLCACAYQCVSVSRYMRLCVRVCERASACRYVCVFVADCMCDEKHVTIGHVCIPARACISL